MGPQTPQTQGLLKCPSEPTPLLGKEQRTPDEAPGNSPRGVDSVLSGLQVHLPPAPMNMKTTRKRRTAQWVKGLLGSRTCAQIPTHPQKLGAASVCDLSVGGRRKADPGDSLACRPVKTQTPGSVRDLVTKNNREVIEKNI